MRSAARVLGLFGILLAAAIGGRLLSDLRAAITTDPITGPRQDPIEYRLAFFDGSRERLLVSDISGATVRDDAIGGTAWLAAPSRDGTRVAIWREAPGGGSTIELIVREVATGGTIVLARVAESPIGAPVWDSQGRELVVGLATWAPPRTPSAPPRSSRLLIIQADGSGLRELATVPSEPLHPVVLSPDLVAAFSGMPGGQRYVVFDAKTGAKRREARAAEFQSFGVDEPSRGWVFGVTKPDLRAQPHQVLRIWSIHDYEANVIEVRSPTINAAAAWPGRDLVVFGTSTRIEVVDVTTGAARNLLTEDTIVAPHAFTPDGAQLLVKRVLAPNWKVFETAGNTVVGSGKPVTVPQGLNEPIGWTR